MSVPYGSPYFDEEEEFQQDYIVEAPKQTYVPYASKPSYSPYELVGDGMGNQLAHFFADHFASSLFLVTFTLFATPIRLTISACNNSQVMYWIGRDIGLYVCILPIFYLFVFLWHTCTRKPSKFLTIISLVGSCVFFLIVCNFVLMNSVFLTEAFAVTECDTFPGKRIVQMERDQARTFYANCAAKKAANSSMEFAAVVAVDRIEDCPGYKEEIMVHPAWPYLNLMEEQMGCSGWCQRDFPIWTQRKDYKDSCSMVASQIFDEVIQNTMKQVVLYTVGVLVIVATLFFMAGPVLRSQGIEW